MNLWAALVYICCAFVFTTEHEISERRSRDNFYSMIKHTTGRDGSQYETYACWCLSRGHGKTLDDIDRCCKSHTACYKSVKGCFPRLADYKYMLMKPERISCITTYKYNKVRLPSGELVQVVDQCAMDTCACDRATAKCLGKYKSDFNWGYQDYNRVRCGF